MAFNVDFSPLTYAAMQSRESMQDLGYMAGSVLPHGVVGAKNLLFGWREPAEFKSDKTYQDYTNDELFKFWEKEIQGNQNVGYGNESFTDWRLRFDPKWNEKKNKWSLKGLPSYSDQGFLEAFNKGVLGLGGYEDPDAAFDKWSATDKALSQLKPEYTSKQYKSRQGEIIHRGLFGAPDDEHSGLLFPLFDKEFYQKAKERGKAGGLFGPEGAFSTYLRNPSDLGFTGEGHQIDPWLQNVRQYGGNLALLGAGGLGANALAPKLAAMSGPERFGTAMALAKANEDKLKPILENVSLENLAEKGFEKYEKSDAKKKVDEALANADKFREKVLSPTLQEHTQNFLKKKYPNSFLLKKDVRSPSIDPEFDPLLSKKQQRRLNREPLLTREVVGSDGSRMKVPAFANANRYKQYLDYRKEHTLKAGGGDMTPQMTFKQWKKANPVNKQIRDKSNKESTQDNNPLDIPGRQTDWTDYEDPKVKEKFDSAYSQYNIMDDPEDRRTWNASFGTGPHPLHDTNIEATSQQLNFIQSGYEGSLAEAIKSGRGGITRALTPDELTNAYMEGGAEGKQILKRYIKDGIIKKTHNGGFELTDPRTGDKKMLFDGPNTSQWGPKAHMWDALNTMWNGEQAFKKAEDYKKLIKDEKKAARKKNRGLWKEIVLPDGTRQRVPISTKRAKKPKYDKDGFLKGTSQSDKDAYFKSVYEPGPDAVHPNTFMESLRQEYGQQYGPKIEMAPRDNSLKSKIDDLKKKAKQSIQNIKQARFDNKQLIYKGKRTGVSQKQYMEEFMPIYDKLNEVGLKMSKEELLEVWLKKKNMKTVSKKPSNKTKRFTRNPKVKVRDTKKPWPFRYERI